MANDASAATDRQRKAIVRLRETLEETRPSRRRGVLLYQIGRAEQALKADSEAARYEAGKWIRLCEYTLLQGTPGGEEWS